MPTAFEQLKAKSANKAGSVAPTVSSSLPTTPTTPAPTSTGSAFDKLKTKGAVASQPTPEPESGPNFFKSLISAPATIVARPLQLGYELVMPGDNTEELDRFSKEKLGGIVAPIPRGASDVVKDVGRAAETVALGTGAPIAGGALFGAGAALENKGTETFTTPEGAVEGLVSTAGGALGGKLLGLVGKPLLNASGKVIGTITPQIIKDVSEKGANAVSQFMARHEILPQGAFKDAVNQIPQVAEKVDEKANQLFKGATGKVKSAVQSQYPGATTENIAKHYEKVELDRLMEPATAPGKTFNKSADVFNQAKKQGVDLRRVAADNKIYASELVNEGKFDTTAVADALSSEAMSGGPQILRPALAAAEPGVARVPISEIRAQILADLKAVPDTKLSPNQKLAFAKRVVAEYGDGSAAAARYPDGYSLTNLYDSKLQTSSGLYKTPKGGGAQSIKDNLTSQLKNIESRVFDRLLEKNAPPELGLDKYFKAQQERFTLANYLRTLDGNKAPQTLFQRSLKKAAQLGGATTGATVAGPFGMFSGYQFGGILADTFGTASNPVKVAFLKSIGKTEPEIYQIMREFTNDAEIARALRKALPGPGENVSPELMKMQNERGAVEMGPHYTGPVTPREKAANDLKLNLRTLYNTPQLPAPSPRIITPNRGGTPNRISDLYKAGGDEGEVGGLRQRTKPKKPQK